MKLVDLRYGEFVSLLGTRPTSELFCFRQFLQGLKKARGACDLMVDLPSTLLQLG